MFFQLDEVNKITRTTDQLEKARQKLNSLIIDAYRPQNTIKKSLSEIIATISDTAQKKLKLFEQIENDSLEGYLIPSYIDLESVVGAKESLPQWTNVVFEKEFEKQKKSLDALAKKMYLAHSLSDVNDIIIKSKDKLIRQINSFKILSDRYRALQQHDQVIDIMSEAEKLKKLTQLTGQKYLLFSNAVASKLHAFCEEMIMKCCNFGSQLGQVAGRSSNGWMQSQQQFKKTIQTQARSDYQTGSGGWLQRANRTFERPSFRNTRNPYDLGTKQPQWLSTYTSEFYN